MTKFYAVRNLLLVVMLGMVGGKGWGQGTFYKLTSSFIPTVTNTNLSSAAPTAGSGVANVSTSPNVTSGYSGTGFPVSATLPTNTTTTYLQFSLTNNTGSTISINNESLTGYYGGTGATISCSFAWRYSLDGFTTSTSLASGITISANSTTTTSLNTTISVTAGTTVTIRVYGYNTDATTATFGVTNLTIGGLAFWPLTTNGSASATANVTAGAQDGPGGGANFSYGSNGVTSSGFTNSSGAINYGQYYRFPITAGAGYNLTISGIYTTNNLSSLTATGQIGYSTATSTYSVGNTTLVGNTFALTSLSTTNYIPFASPITVLSGSTTYILLFVYKGASDGLGTAQTVRCKWLTIVGSVAAASTPDATKSTLTPTSASIIANGSSTQVLTVQAKDATNTNITTGGATVTITKQTGLGTISSVTDNANGTYTATVTSPTTTGSGVFVATINSSSVQSGGGIQTQSTITYTPGVANATKSTLTPTSASIVANGTSTQVLTVQAKDVNNNNLTSGGLTVTITRQSGTGAIGAVTDNGNGTYTATVTSPIATSSGVFVATVNGAAVQSGAASQTQSTINYIPGAANAMQSTLTPTSASIAADGVSTQVLTVRAKDANGNNLTNGGTSVTITQSSGSGTISPVADNGNGIYTATVTSATSAGSGVFVATLGGSAVQSGGGSQTQATVTYLANAPAASQSTLTPTTSSMVANGINTQVLTVQAKDASGINVSTGGSTVTITKLSGTGTISGVTDNNDGTYTATVTSPTATGSGVFVATLGGSAVQSGGGSQTQATVTYIAGAANAVQSTLTPTSASIVANGSSTQVLTLQAKDANGNTITTGGLTVTITKLSGTGTIGSVTDNANGTYTATVTAPSATGSGVFVATLGGSAVQSGGGSQTQSTITYIAGAANAVQSTLTPTSAGIVANGSGTKMLTVRAKDANGNNLTTGGLTVTITQLSGTGTISGVTDNNDGTYTATVTAPTATGSGVFVATLGGSAVQSGGGSQTQSTITYVAAAANANRSTLAPTSASIVANGSSTQVLTVQARDANSNNVTIGGSTVTITKLSGTGTISGVTDNNDGTYTATVTSPTATGSGVFVATLGGSAVQSGGGSQTQATVTYIAGAANAVQSTLTPTSASIVANGSSTQVLTLQAKDANGNTITTGGLTVTITKLSGTGTIGSVTDNANGTYTATVTAPSATGSGVFVATLGGSAVQSGGGSQTQSTITYAPVPLITTSVTALAAFTTTAGTPSTAQAFTVSGSNLQADIIVMPPSGYEISQTSATAGFGSTQTITQSGGTVNATVYVRLTSAATAGSYSGNVSLTTTSAVTKNVSVSGTVNSVFTLIAGWDFQTTTNGGTASDNAPNTPTVFQSNFGTGTIYLNGTNGSSTWSQISELNAFDGTTLNTTNTSFSTVVTAPATLSIISNTANNKNIVFKFDMGGYKNLNVSYATRGTSTGFSNHIWSYSTNGTTWTTIQTITGRDVTSYSVQNLPTITALDNITSAYLRLTVSGATNTSGNNRIDNIQLNATLISSPSITVGGGPITSVSTAYGTPSTAPTSFTLTGTGLSSNISLAAVSGFEYSTTSGGTYSSTLSLPAAGGNVFVRLASSATVGAYSGSIVASSGSTSVSIPLASSTVSPAPLTITANNASKCEGQTLAFAGTEFTTSTLYNGNTVTGVTLTSSGAASGATSGTYSIIPSSATGTGLVNYTITYANGTLTVNPLPTATISGTTSVCQNTTAPNITFIGSNGTAPYTFTYNINGGTNQTVTSGGGTNPVSVTVAAPTSTTGTFTYNLVGVSGQFCSQAQSSSAVVTVSASPVTPTITAGGPTTFCTGGSVVLTSSSSMDNQWYKDGVSIGGATNQTYTATASGDYTVSVTNAGGCSSTSAAKSVTLTSTNTWIGLSTVWTDGNNWCTGTPPSGSTNAIISSDAPNYPVLVADAAVNDLQIKPGAKITIGANTFTINGDVTGAGMLVGSSTSNLVIGGSGGTGNLYFDQTTDNTTNVLNSLTVNRSSGNIAIANKLNLLSVLTVTTGTLSSGGNLVLRSTDIDKTARVATVGSNGFITGDVISERFIPATARAYRFISPSVTTGTSIRQNWMENQNNPSTTQNLNSKPGYGTHITGNAGDAGGFDVTQNNSPSLFGYNNSTEAWSNVTSTSGNLTAGVPLRLFVRGDRGISLASNTPTPTNTILRATGALRTGTIVYNSTSTPAIIYRGNALSYDFVGNPYASPVDWNQLAKNNLGPTYWCWDPHIGGKGVYVSYNGANGHTNFDQDSKVNSNLQPGQAFFVEVKGSSPSLEFEETDKTSVFTAVFRTPGSEPVISANLFYNDTSGTRILADGVTAIFDDSFSKWVSDEDSYKFTNNDENLCINHEDTMLSIEGRPISGATDTLKLKLWQYRQKSYVFKVNVKNFPAGTTAVMKDAYLNKETLLSITDSTLVPFSLTTDSASFAPDRFIIVFKPGSVLPVTVTDVKAYQKEKGIQVDWISRTETNISRYEVEKSLNGRDFEKSGSVEATGNNTAVTSYGWFDATPAEGNNFYRVKVIEKSGAVKYTQIVKVTIGKANSSMTVYPNPVKGSTISLHMTNMEKGRYTATLYNNLGQKMMSRQIEHIGGSANYSIATGRVMPKGTYRLTATNGETEMTATVVFE